MKNRHLVALLAVSLVLAGWKPTIVRSPSPEEDAKAKLFSPEADRALLYVYRDNSLLGSDAQSQLVINDAVVGKNERNRFIVVSLEPGSYKLLSLSAKNPTGMATLVHNSRKTAVELTAEAGKIYFYQDVFKALGGFSLKTVPASDAMAVIVKEKLFARYER